MARSLFAALCAAELLLMTACEVRMKDLQEDDERETVEVESWTSGPGGSTYSFVKCETAAGETGHNICGTRLEDTSGPKYNWQTNCSGSSCESVSVFAHYMLSDDLGQQGILNIEAFQNPQFNGSPVASLQIQGFDARKPTSSKLEEIFLAPGEYYFRAFISPKDSSPVPYSLQGLELVSDAPVGVLGALSGAERVLVKGTNEAAGTVHIYINQLYKKTAPLADTFAKIRLELSVSPEQLSKVERYRDVHVLLLKDADLEVKPVYDFTFNTTELLNSEATYFVSPSVEPGDYYVFAFIDANGNRYFDEHEIGQFVNDNAAKPALVTLEKDRTKGLKLLLK